MSGVQCAAEIAAGGKRANTRVARSVAGWPLLLALVAGFAAFVAVRIPSVFHLGRFWAEEASVYFRNAWNDPWYDALFAVHSGYINLSASLATLLSVYLVPIADAPLLTSGFALLIQTCSAILLATSGVAWLGRPAVLLAAMLLAAVPLQSGEVWLNSITSQFHLGLCAALILAFPTRGGAIGVFRGVLLVLGGLSGPASGFLTPLFVLRAFLDRSSGRVFQAVLLGSAVVIQALMVWMHPDAGRSFGIGPQLLTLVVFIKHMVLPMAGANIARRLAARILEQVRNGQMPWLPYAVTLAAAGLAIAGVVRARNREVTWLFAAGVTIMGASYFGALGDHSFLVGIDFGMRYAYVPNALFGLTLLGIAANTTAEVRGVAGALTVWLLLIGLKGYFHTDPGFATGPAWRDELAKWRLDPAYEVQVWAGGGPWRASLGPPPGTPGFPR